MIEIMSRMSSQFAWIRCENVIVKQPKIEPAYAEVFGVAGAHSSRRSEAKEERPTT